MFIFLMVVQALVAAALVGVILMQRSEGGGLGTGGSPAGLMSARGAADLLTRSTAILATIFVALSIALAVLAVEQTSGRSIDQSLDRKAVAPQPTAPADPLAPAAQNAPSNAGSVAATSPAPAAKPTSADPLAGAAKK